MKLTAKTIAALTLPVGKADHIAWDEDLPGFGFRLRTGAGGKLLKSWGCQHKRNGTSRRMTFDAVLGAEQARAEARRVLAKVELGQDPSGKKTESLGSDRLSFKSRAPEYVEAPRPG